MDNELMIEQTWWKRNLKWFLPTFIVLFSLLFGLLLSLIPDGNVTDIAKAYSDNLLYEKAIEKANTNKRVLEVIGEIEPIDKLAILEGNIIYSNNHNLVELTIRIKGDKEHGKMHIYAKKIGKQWKYIKINIQIKASKEIIQVLGSIT